MKIARSKSEKPVAITSVGESLTEDQSSRQRRYFISMMVRTLCFISAVILPNPYRWVALFGALILPYISVLIANAGRENIHGKTKYFAAFTGRKELDA